MNGSSVLSPAHSEIGASSMHRWAACPGSVRLSRGIPSKSSPYAEEGTLAHEVLAEILSGDVVKPRSVSKDMAEAVAVCVEYVDTLREKVHKLFVEHKFDLSSVHPGLFGTADVVVYVPSDKTLHVIDYKHGAGIPVEVKENVQLLYYALGAYLSFDDLEISRVVIHIVQPRCPHPDGPARSWEICPTELIDFADELKKYAVATEAPGAPLVAGEHCRFCPAAAICPEIKNRALTEAKKAFTDISSFDPEELARALHWLPTLEGWIENVRAFAYNAASQGEVIPGFKLVAKRATRKWADPAKAEKFLVKNFPKAKKFFFEEPSLKSPKQIEDVLSKKDHKKLEALVVSVSSGNKLVPEKDSGTPVVVTSARDAFDDL